MVSNISNTSCFKNNLQIGLLVKVESKNFVRNSWFTFIHVLGGTHTIRNIVRLYSKAY